MARRAYASVLYSCIVLVTCSTAEVRHRCCWGSSINDSCQKKMAPPTFHEQTFLLSSYNHISYSFIFALCAHAGVLHCSGCRPLKNDIPLAHHLFSRESPTFSNTNPLVSSSNMPFAILNSPTLLFQVQTCPLQYSIPPPSCFKFRHSLCNTQFSHPLVSSSDMPFAILNSPTLLFQVQTCPLQY